MLDLDTSLAEALGSRQLVEAMQKGIALFPSYRDRLATVPFAYTRTQLIATPEYEMVAILWAPGSRSTIHDHGSSRCWVMNVEGTLEVENYDRLDDGGEFAKLARRATIRVERGGCDNRYNWREMHRVSNPSDVAAYTVQLYAAPLSTYSVVIDESTGRCGTVQSSVDAIYHL